MKKIRVVHYVNQFYGQIGGEDKADIAPILKEGFVGPGMQINNLLKDRGEVVATVICGDNYFNENVEEATNTVLEMIGQHKPDILVAGPAFNAGRYGMACGAVCKAVEEEFGIPTLTGMYIESPGVDSYRKYTYVVETANSAVGMRKALPAMVDLLIKLVDGVELGTPEEEGYIARGVRRNYFHSERGAKRAVDMLIKKINDQPFVTEYPMPTFDRVAPEAPILDMTKATVALVTSGGIVPKGNPDHIESSSATKYGRYDLEGVEDLTEATYETAHGGYDPVYANLDSDRVLPVDVLRDLEKEGKIGKLYRYFYSTVGNGTSVANSVKFAEAIGKELVENGVDAVILTST
jgi:glycine reductase